MIKTANLVGSISRDAGGLFESVRRLVQSLAGRGMDVRVLGLRDRFTDTDVAAWNPVPVAAFQPTWPQPFGYSGAFLEELAAFAPDLTHTHGIWMYLSAATNSYCKHSRTPYLISAHGMLDPWAIRNSRWKKAIAYFLYEKSHLRGARCLRALCDAEARGMREVGLTNDIAIIPNGIDLPQLGNHEEPSRVWPPSPPEEERAGERRLSIVDDTFRAIKADGRKVLLYLGRIHPKKGLANLLKAWAATRNQQLSTINSWVLAVVGWDQGGHEAELKCLATELGIPWTDQRTINHQQAHSEQACLFFLGPQFDEGKAACYRSCDAFILPSFSEGVPMVVLEAWAYAKPVLMTPECNLPEGFATESAIRIEPNVESIKRGLETLFQSTDSILQSTGLRGRKIVEKRYAWPHIAQEMTCLYEWMLGGGTKPSSIADF